MIVIEQLDAERAEFLGFHVGLQREFGGFDAVPFGICGRSEGKGE
jgi:hypothetical protein